MNDFGYFVLHFLSVTFQSLWVIPVNAPLFLLGWFLHNSRLMSSRRVLRKWSELWTWCDLTVNDSPDFNVTGDSDGDDSIDFKMFNESKFAEVFLESLPQLILQVINFQLITFGGKYGRANISNNSLIITYLSISISAISVASVAYFCIYYYLYLGIDFSSVPVAMWGVGTLNTEEYEARNTRSPLVDLSNFVRRSIERMAVEDSIELGNTDNPQSEIQEWKCEMRRELKDEMRELKSDMLKRDTELQELKSWKSDMQKRDADMEEWKTGIKLEIMEECKRLIEKDQN